MNSLAKVIATSLAASIEWYDFFIYGTAAALVFPAFFAPSTRRAIAAFSTFAVGFIARPVGGAVRAFRRSVRAQAGAG